MVKNNKSYTYCKLFTGIFSTKNSMMLLFIVSIVTNFVFAATISVPGNYNSIQAAINAANDGDEIVVSPGTYKETINFNGKNIFVRSTFYTNANAIGTTIIDGDNNRTTVRFSGGEDSNSSIQGFTITGGDDFNGGGIDGNGTHATIGYNFITDNNAVNAGGGIYNCNGTLVGNYIYKNDAFNGGGIAYCQGHITGNTIDNNDATEAGGGILKCDGTIESCTIINNSATNDIRTGLGGGLYNCDGTVQYNYISSNEGDFGGGIIYSNGTVQFNNISNNKANIDGGGLAYCSGIIQSNDISNNTADNGAGMSGGYVSATIRGNIIVGNFADVSGGGLSACAGVIDGNAIYYNSADNSGGGIAISNSLIENNFVAFNTCKRVGGGIFSCTGTIQNNTVFQNTASNTGGGISNCTGTIKNCIVWNNKTSRRASQINASSTPSYSDIQGGIGRGTGNISVDPQFVNRGNGDLHLLSNSPCVDAGGSVNLDHDIDGDSRPIDATTANRGDGSNFDMGADELAP